MRLILILILLSTFNIQAQTKVEEEISIKDEQVPKNALELVKKHIDKSHKVKWYFQKDGKKEVFEAKFKQFNNRFSVEFLKSGKIYNVEVNNKKNSIDKNTLKLLNSQLQDHFENFKIVKIQTEYLGSKEDLIEIFSENEIDEDLECRFEIEVNAKEDGQRILYELIFDKDIALLSKRKIKLKSTDILDY